MPVKLSDIQTRQDTQKVVLHYDSGDLNLVIYPGIMNMGFLRKLKEAEQNTDLPLLGSLFFALIDEWDLLDDEGEIYPLEESTLDLFDISFFLNIIQGIQGVLAPKAMTTTSSSGQSKARNSTRRK